MKYRTLGRTGLLVSEVGFGGGGIGAVWGATTRRDSIRAVYRALELGVNFYDVAPGYGRGLAEEILGEALGTMRFQVFITTKFAMPKEEWGDVAGATRRSLEASLRRLRTDYVDIFMVHNRIAQTRDQWPWAATAEDALEMVGVMRDLVKEGKVRYVGFTAWNGYHPGLRKIIESGQVDVVQAEYHLLNQTAQDPPPPGSFIHLPEEELKREKPDGEYGPMDQGQVIPLSVRHNVGVIGIRPLMAGALSEGVDRQVEPGSYLDKYFQAGKKLRFLVSEAGYRTLSKAAMVFCLMNQDIATIIPGVKNAAEIEEAASCSGAHPISTEYLLRIQELYNRNFDVQW